jgi:hypothetical protein
MAHQTRLLRRQVYRPTPGRQRYLRVSPRHVRRVLRAFEALFRA